MRTPTTKTVLNSVVKHGAAVVTAEDVIKLGLLRIAKENGLHLVMPLDGTWVRITSINSVGSDQYETIVLFYIGTLRETNLTLRGSDMVTLEPMTTEHIPADSPKGRELAKAAEVAAQDEPKKKRPVYVQTPDGVTHKRVTDRVYTHAIAALWPKGWVILNYCGSAELAVKAAGRAVQANVRILPVVEVEPTAMVITEHLTPEVVEVEANPTAETYIEAARTGQDKTIEYIRTMPTITLQDVAGLGLFEAAAAAGDSVNECQLFTTDNTGRVRLLALEHEAGGDYMATVVSPLKDDPAYTVVVPGYYAVTLEFVQRAESVESVFGGYGLPEVPRAIAEAVAADDANLIRVLKFVSHYETETETRPSAADVSARFMDVANVGELLAKGNAAGYLFAEVDGYYNITADGLEIIEPTPTTAVEATPERFEVRAEVFQVPGDYRLKDEDGADLEPGYYYWFVQAGCLPDSEPFGVYHSADEARKAAADELNDYEVLVVV